MLLRPSWQDGSEAQPAGSEAQPAGSEARLAGSEAQLAGSEARLAGSEAWLTGSEILGVRGGWTDEHMENLHILPEPAPQKACIHQKYANQRYFLCKFFK